MQGIKLRRPCMREGGAWISCWAVTTAAVVAGAIFGNGFVKSDGSPGFLDSLARIDGQNYRHIAENGYAYQPNAPSNVAFFPAFPLAARWLARATGLGTVPAQLLVSNVCCVTAFLLMGAYLQRRVAPEHGVRLDSTSGIDSAHVLAGDSRRPRDVSGYALLAMGLLPTTIFFRMAYTESMLLCLAILSLYGIVRAWPLPVVALVVGLATAVRPVGVALLLPLFWYAWRGSDSRRQVAYRLAYALPLGCWGLVAYMLYLYLDFGQPLAFALTQEHHRMRPAGTMEDKLLSLLSWEPIRDTYNPLSPGYWQALHYSPSRLFSLEFANPIYLIGTAALIAWGAWKRWLTTCEILLAVPLLAIPYFTRAYEMRMLSQARFAAVVFPAYIVLGHLLARMPLVIAGALLALSGLFMGLFAALFAAGYPFL
jgi:hypothetical protein